MSDESVSEEPIIKRTCAGRCGAILHYLLAPEGESRALVLTCLDSVTAYREGHLCIECDAAVEEALACRREARQRETWEKERAARRARVRGAGRRR